MLILVGPALGTNDSIDVYIYVINLISSSILLGITVYRAYSRRKKNN